MVQDGQKDHESVSKIGIHTANSSPNPNKHLLSYLSNAGSPGATAKKSTINTYIKTILSKGTLSKNAANKLTKDNASLANKLKSIKQKNEADQAGYRGALSYRDSQYYSGVGHSQTKKPANQRSNDNSYQFNFSNLSASKKKKSLGESALKSQLERKSSSKSLKRKLGENFVNMSNSNIHHCYQHGQTSRKSSNPQLFSTAVNVSINAQGQPTKTSGTVKNDTFKKIGLKFEKIFGHKLSEKAFVERTPSRGKFLQQKGKKSSRVESEKSRISNDYYQNTSTRKSPGESPYNISKINRIKVQNYHTGRPNAARDHGASGQKIYPSALDNSGLGAYRANPNDRSDLDEYNYNFCTGNSPLFNTNVGGEAEQVTSHIIATDKHFLEHGSLSTIALNNSNSRSNLNIDRNFFTEKKGGMDSYNFGGKNETSKDGKEAAFGVSAGLLAIKNSINQKKKFLRCNSLKENTANSRNLEGYVFDHLGSGEAYPIMPSQE